jgi:hypothetical protein
MNEARATVVVDVMTGAFPHFPGQTSNAMDTQRNM